MKVSSIEINNFKSLTGFKSSKFASVNLIHGVNNSGKSNFLKFLDLLFMRKCIMSTESYLDDKGIRQTRQKVDQYTPFWKGYIYDFPYIYKNDEKANSITFEVLINVDATDLNYAELLSKQGYLYSDGGHTSTPLVIKGEIKAINSFDSEIILQKATLKGRNIFLFDEAPIFFPEETADSPIAEDKEGIFTSALEPLTDCILLIESERMFSKEQLNGSPQETFNTANFKNWLYGIYLDSEKFSHFRSLVTFLNNFKLTGKAAESLNENFKNFPFRDTKLTFSKFKDEIEIMLENAIGRFPLKNYGTGIQQILYILAKLFNTQAKIILIEELELNLSPEYQELIINNLKELTQTDKIDQVFFTSHSDYLCRTDFKIYQVEIDEKGVTSMKEDDLKKVRSLRRTLQYLPAPKEE